MSNPATTPAREQAKAIIGGILAGLTALGTALADGVVSPVEVVGITIALLATYGTVFGVSNDRPGIRNEVGAVRAPSYEGFMRHLEKRARNARGAVSVLEVLLVVLVVVVLLALLGVL